MLLKNSVALCVIILMFLVVLNLSISFICPLQCTTKVILPIAQLAKYSLEVGYVRC